MSKHMVFKTELGILLDSEVKVFTINMLNKLPDYFYTCAASSTGKYHPSYALGEGGLVRHTKAAVRIAHELLNLEMFKNLMPKQDIILSALLLHDGLKHGLGGKYTVADHPMQASKFISDNCPEEFKAIGQEVSALIETHMGQWNTDYKTKKEIMPKPTKAIEKFVHLCDYLASRKMLEVNFEVSN